MKFPIVPTTIVSLAVSAMIGLGVWQIQRANWKEALLATYAANARKPAMTFPEIGPVPDAAMFRVSQVNCLKVVTWRAEGSIDRDGRPGTRHIADCALGATGQGALIDLGVSRDPKGQPSWAGGIVDGIITTEPDHRSLIGKLFAQSVVLRPMLVAREAPAGLIASPPPSPNNVPNNHMAYAVQWFLFAAAALVIYIIALRKRPSA